MTSRKKSPSPKTEILDADPWATLDQVVRPLIIPARLPGEFTRAEFQSRYDLTLHTARALIRRLTESGALRARVINGKLIYYSHVSGKPLE
jgi:Fic family protein